MSNLKCPLEVTSSASPITGHGYQTMQILLCLPSGWSKSLHSCGPFPSSNSPSCIHFSAENLGSHQLGRTESRQLQAASPQALRQPLQCWQQRTAVKPGCVSVSHLIHWGLGSQTMFASKNSRSRFLFDWICHSKSLA